MTQTFRNYNPETGNAKAIRTACLWEYDGDGNAMLKDQPYDFYDDGLWSLDDGNNVAVSPYDRIDNIWEKDVDGNLILKEVI